VGEAAGTASRAPIARQAAVVTEHLRSDIATFLAYNKSVACLTKAGALPHACLPPPCPFKKALLWAHRPLDMQGVDEITGKQRYQVHSYRFETKRKV
jgi:hypothetical protein